MSWDQGYQAVEDLPKALVERLNSYSEGEVQCITWYEPNKNEFVAHYYKDGAFLETKELKFV